MAPASHVIDGHGPSNDIYSQNDKGRAVLVINITAKGILPAMHYQQDQAVHYQHYQPCIYCTET